MDNRIKAYKVRSGQIPQVLENLGDRFQLITKIAIPIKIGIESNYFVPGGLKHRAGHPDPM